MLDKYFLLGGTIGFAIAWFQRELRTLKTKGILEGKSLQAKRKTYLNAATKSILLGIVVSLATIGLVALF